MDKNKKNIYVFANWIGLKEPTFMGVLYFTSARGKVAYSFEFDKQWFATNKNMFIDPEINWFTGLQFASNKNFGVFQDAMPDTWGRTLMKRRVVQQSKINGSNTTLNDYDYLLGIYDPCRLGALRFKTEMDGPFLDNNTKYATPPWTSINELQYGINLIESEKDNKESRKWLEILVAPGSSLGGTRPKANVLDAQNNLWIAKFPSKNDTIDKGAWEFVAYKLALKAGVKMAESKLQKVTGNYHTFFTKRFDRKKDERIHFTSAMTMTNNSEEKLKFKEASYLEIAEFLQSQGANIKNDLHQLWRRLVFNILISNTDDHLRNHGFLLSENGWILSPSYDINPSVDKNGLALNIDLDSNELSIELAFSVGKYFRLTDTEMQIIYKDVKKAVVSWQTVAKSTGIKRLEIAMMEQAFKI